MKKIFPPLLILFLLFSVTSQAQFLIGPKVGLTYSNMHFDNSQYHKEYDILWRPGINAGMVVNYAVSRSSVWSFHSEIYYNEKGRTIERRGTNYVKNKTRFRHIDVPMLFRGTFSLGRGSGVKVYVNAGPTISYWISGGGLLATSELDQGNVGELRFKYDFKGTHRLADGYVNVPNANRFQVGLDFGFGFEFEVLDGQIVQWDFRYNATSTNIGTAKDNNIGLFKYYEDFAGANRCIETSLAFLFGYDPKFRRKGKSTLKR